MGKKQKKYQNRISLYSMDRGINRFKGLEMTLRECVDAGFLQEDLTDLREWIGSTDILSNQSLEEQIGKTGSPILKKVLGWSVASNRAIAALPESQMFDGVKEALDMMNRYADLAVVSSANREAVEAKWERHGILPYVKAVMTQDCGSKAVCIARLMEEGYEGDQVLMIGDAPGDQKAAEKNGALFYPAVIRREQRAGSGFYRKVFHVF